MAEYSADENVDESTHKMTRSRRNDRPVVSGALTIRGSIPSLSGASASFSESFCLALSAGYSGTWTWSLPGRPR